MKKIFTLLLLLVSFGACAQGSLSYFNHSREQIKHTGMTVLGGWAVSNIAVGGISSFNTTGSTKYFHQMNALWNLVNLGAATSGLVSAQKNRDKNLTADEVIKEQRKIEKIFLVNGLLDLAYIGGGTYLNRRGINENDDKLKGYGASIILQGAFLLLFDATMYTSEKHNGKKLVQFLQTHPVSFDGQKIGVVFKL